MKNFIETPDCDYDRMIAQREIVGRVTKSRDKSISEYVRRWNKKHEAPYGYSPNGYDYSCGCEHDCCGCLSGESLSMDVKPNKITITWVQSFNY